MSFPWSVVKSRIWEAGNWMAPVPTRFMALVLQLLLAVTVTPVFTVLVSCMFLKIAGGFPQVVQLLMSPETKAVLGAVTIVDLYYFIGFRYFL
ncbi:hypothetical protein [uncultured Chryseobacterium sp.]|uniref:hypothetical protein n=1 Tax=uncultured Chryseobacterium sp. TaxID=259322 RepID=UPI0025D44460|nr:hypothetical protein [uncultured Chryseobacterium sp.]